MPMVAALREADWVSQVTMRDQPWIGGAPALVSMDDNQDAWVLVSNASPVERVLE